MATITQLASGNWRVQVRRKTRYVAETFRRRKDGEEWALEMERNIDRNFAAGAVRTFHRCGDTGRAPVNAFKSENGLHQNSSRIPQRSGARVSLRVPGELAVELSGWRPAVGKAQLGARGGERQALPLKATRTVETSQWRCISWIEWHCHQEPRRLRH